MLRIWPVIAAVAACGGARDDRPSTGVDETSSTVAAARDAVAALAPVDATRQPDAGQQLADSYPRLAAIIAARVAQSSPKMKLTAEEGRRVSAAAAAQLARSAPLRALAEIMPKSTIELARAIAERGLPEADADAIASYLARLTRALDFARLDRFDENHSHVTGRRWHEIDYSGEKMTWQGQRAYWSKKGVPDFRSAGAVDAYMRHAYELPHFARVYRPRGSFDDLDPEEP